MGHPRFEFWRRWLLFAVASTAGLGVLLIVADTRVLPWYPTAINRALWGSSQMPESVVTYHRLANAVLGATLTSWAVALLFVIQLPLRAGERWAFVCLVTSLLVWFVPDTAMSLVYGAAPNAVFNVAALLWIGTPLVALAPEFSRRGPLGSPHGARR